METKRQRQLSNDIQRIVAPAFNVELKPFLENAFVTVSDVRITPDLLVARIFISVLQKEKAEKVLENLLDNRSVLRGIVGNQLKNKVRRIPEIEFHLDESLEKVFEIEHLLRKTNIREEE